MKTRFFPIALLLVAGFAPAPLLHAQLTHPAIIWSQQEPDASTHRAAIAYSPDGKLVASGRADWNDVKLWNATNGAPVRTLTGKNNNANVIRFSPDSQYLATGTGQPGQGLSLNLWRVSDGVRLVGRIGAFPNGTIGVDFSRDGGRLVAVGFHHRTYKIYRVPDMMLLTEVGNYDPELGYNVITRAVAFSPDGELLAAGVDVLDETYGTCTDCAVKMFRVADGALVKTYSNGNH